MALLLALGWIGCSETNRAAEQTARVRASTGIESTQGRTPRGSGGINTPETLSKPYVVLVSIDGFRHDYRDRYDTPTLDRVADTGAVADALIPVYPTLTFPNHYTIATGLYPQRHGLVGNRFYDPIRGEEYNYRERVSVQDGTWYRGEPIWVTAETQGMVTAALFFVGTEMALDGVRPTYWTEYDGRLPDDDRVEQVLEWLRLPERERPHLVTLYFSGVDSAGHDAGPVSDEVRDAIRGVDFALGRLLDGIEQLPHGDLVSIVVVSDHGMGLVDHTLTTDLRAVADMQDARIVVTGTGANLFVGGDRERARQLRDDINGDLHGGRAYLRDEMPDTLHYRSDPRIGDVVVVASPGALVGLRDDSSVTGMHGWSPDDPEMHGILLARGPEIVKGARVRPLENIHVYPLLARLLRVTPAPDIDGDPSVLASWVDAASAQP